MIDAETNGVAHGAVHGNARHAPVVLNAKVHRAPLQSKVRKLINEYIMHYYRRELLKKIKVHRAANIRA